MQYKLKPLLAFWVLWMVLSPSNSSALTISAFDRQTPDWQAQYIRWLADKTVAVLVAENKLEQAKYVSRQFITKKGARTRGMNDFNFCMQVMSRKPQLYDVEFAFNFALARACIYMPLNMLFSYSDDFDYVPHLHSTDTEKSFRGSKRP